MESINTKHDAEGERVVSETVTEHREEVHIKISEHDKENTLHSAPLQAEESISISWTKLTYTITNKKTKKPENIIENCCGTVKPGEILAIMGPSGAGKSTLLDVLAGRKDPKNVTGTIYLNGKSGENVKFVSTYVMQDDALMGSLTVRENIQFAADLCFPSTISSKERRQKVAAIIKEFGLERVADHKVGNIIIRGISGGEKRRTAIASQFVTHPKIIFLDEPTTGLDSAAAYSVMNAIITTAKMYKLTVIASIHQPSSEVFALFDKLYLISRGGTVYHGSREGALEYFKDQGYECPEHANPADFYLSKINVDFMSDKVVGEAHIQALIGKYKESSAKLLVDKEIDELSVLIDKEDAASDKLSTSTTTQGYNRYARGFFAQTYFITKRSFTNAYRNILLYWIRVAMYVCLALLMGSVWWQVEFDQKNIQDRFSAHFFSVAFLVFMSVAGIPGFLEERVVFRRERADGFYSVGPYALANFIVSIPFVFVIALTFTIVAYPMIGLHSGFNHFMLFLAFLYLALMVAESMVVFVAAVLPIFVVALTIVAFLNGFFMVVQGFFVRRDSIPHGWKWAHYIDYQKYAFEAIIKNDFVGLTFNCDVVEDESTGLSRCACFYGDTSGKSCTFTGQDVLNAFGYTEIKLWLWAVALLGLTIIFRIGFYAALRLRKNRL
ncbi:2305_t:CDS:2 [Paraglomus brasilianum]|uniref:2305_t:CDS:1 n=1 Tax=Paraglomus brasilianum TaxID=144538 RepID=A0A9N9D7G8_9GLOM|nr:2305_t:CDS:2 [Paraglomus brasilianum]